MESHGAPSRLALILPTVGSPWGRYLKGIQFGDDLQRGHPLSIVFIDPLDPFRLLSFDDEFRADAFRIPVGSVFVGCSTGTSLYP